MTKSLFCAWAPPEDVVYRTYHDREWGVPQYDSRTLWEKLQLDGMQAGLAWITILRKRDSIRDEFDQFDPESIARWNDARIERALQNPGIIRSRQKIVATIGNAKAFLQMAEQDLDFCDYCWNWVDGRPIVNDQFNDYRKAPTKTALSEAMSKDLRNAASSTLAQRSSTLGCKRSVWSTITNWGAPATKKCRRSLADNGLSPLTSDRCSRNTSHQGTPVNRLSPEPSVHAPTRDTHESRIC